MSRPPARQDIELRDFDAGTWVLLDSRIATVGSDGTVTLELVGNVGRFIEDGTNTIRARIQYKATQPVFSFPWRTRVDQVKWLVVR